MLAALRGLGATVGEISLPTLQHAVAAYYLISTPEASSNLARYDGMVYGARVDAGDVNTSMSQARGAGFGREVKRRILIGTYALSSGYYDAYYSKAMKVRRLIADDFGRAFGQFDILVTPTSPFPAFRRGEKVSDPVAMYAADVDTVGVSLAGLPALSVPAGFETVDGKRLPVGIQLIAPALGDEKLLTVADALERSGAVKVELARAEAAEARPACRLQPGRPAPADPPVAGRPGPLERLAEIHEFDLQLATDLELAGQRADFLNVGQDAEAFLNRWVSVPPDLHAMLSIRFQGLDVTKPSWTPRCSAAR